LVTTVQDEDRSDAVVGVFRDLEFVEVNDLSSHDHEVDLLAFLLEGLAAEGNVPLLVDLDRSSQDEEIVADSLAAVDAEVAVYCVDD
jgi:hypothetical protein